MNKYLLVAMILSGCYVTKQKHPCPEPCQGKECIGIKAKLIDIEKGKRFQLGNWREIFLTEYGDTLKCRWYGLPVNPCLVIGRTYVLPTKLYHRRK